MSREEGCYPLKFIKQKTREPYCVVRVESWVRFEMEMYVNYWHNLLPDRIEVHMYKNHSN